jgi:hypothetical protein
MAALQRGGFCVTRIRTTFSIVAAFHSVLAIALAATSLAGCATPVADEHIERLDTTTGTTVTVLPKPVELVVDRGQGPKTDPFAYIAPFETNRMGTHELFLWVSAPQVAGPLGVPQVFCGETPVTLEKFDGTLKDVGLSTAPYKTPAPWSAQWYFRLSGEVLDCFGSASRLRIVTKAADAAESETYTAEGPALSALGPFVAKVRT